MNTIRNTICLASLVLPIASMALTVEVSLVDLPRQTDFDMAQASIAAEGHHILPYTLVGGFDLYCAFGNGQVIKEQRPGSFSGGSNTLFVPGPTPALGSWMMSGLETVPHGQCRVCTLVYKAIITSSLNANFSGTGASVSFGPSGLEAIHTKTFSMCNRPECY
jgi:hypothetical protein